MSLPSDMCGTITANHKSSLASVARLQWWLRPRQQLRKSWLRRLHNASGKSFCAESLISPIMQFTVILQMAYPSSCHFAYTVAVLLQATKLDTTFFLPRNNSLPALFRHKHNI